MAHQLFENLLERNQKHIETYKPVPTLQQLIDNSPPNRGNICIISCSDPRICPEEFLGLKRGEALVIRNAGGRTVDAIRSLEVMGTIGQIHLIVVIHHEDCGGLFTNDDEIQQKLGERTPEHKHEIEGKNFGTYQKIGLRQSVLDDLEVIRNWNFLPEYTQLKGFQYSIADGSLKEVV